MLRFLFFANTNGKGNVYTYHSFKIHPEYNEQSYYGTVQYGVSNYFDLVGDISTNINGLGMRWNALNKKEIAIGGQHMVSFDLNRNYRYKQFSNGLYLNGMISDNLGYCINSFWTLPGDYFNTWYYLSYSIIHFHTMIGITHDMSSHKADLTAGIYRGIGKCSNLYLWFGNILKRKVTSELQ